MAKFGGKEVQYEYWKLQFQASYGSRSIPVREKILFLLSLLEGEPANLCARFVRHSIDDSTYETLWEQLDQRYGGQIREDQQVMEEFEKVKVLESYDIKEIASISDCLISVSRLLSEGRSRIIVTTQRASCSKSKEKVRTTGRS